MEKEIFGSGKEWNVYQHPRNPDHLIKEAKTESIKLPEISKQRFYLGRVLHILFPNNIPDIHAVNTKNGEVFEVQKIKLDKDSDEIRKLYQDKSITTFTETDLNFYKRIISHPQYEILVNKLKGAGLYIEVVPENFGFDTSNNLFYLDSDVSDPDELEIPMLQLILNLGKLIDEMESEKQKQKAKLYLKQLERLQIEILRKLGLSD